MTCKSGERRPDLYKYRPTNDSFYNDRYTIADDLYQGRYPVYMWGRKDASAPVYNYG